MENKPSISIIIPIYNSELYLKECLDSVCNQTLKNIEIICVNDGSTDLSLNIIHNYFCIDKRIKIINQSNLGVSAARKNGVLQASAEYIGFIDSDDYIEKDYFEKLYNIAIFENSDITVTGNLKEFDEKKMIKRILLKYNYKKNLNDIDRCKLFVIQTGLWNKIYKKTLIIKALSYYDDNRNDGEDAQLLIFLFLFAKQITYSNTACYYYRINNNSLSRRNTTIDEVFNIFNMYNNTYKKLCMIQFNRTDTYCSYFLKRRNMHIFKKLCLLPNLLQKFKFLLKTKDFSLLLSCFIRFLIKKCCPHKIRSIIYYIYNNFYLRNQNIIREDPERRSKNYL